MTLNEATPAHEINALADKLMTRLAALNPKRDRHEIARIQLHLSKCDRLIQSARR
jgi:hypothetical protein